jgi:hypothetical protein
MSASLHRNADYNITCNERLREAGRSGPRYATGETKARPERLRSERCLVADGHEVRGLAA